MKKSISIILSFFLILSNVVAVYADEPGTAESVLSDKERYEEYLKEHPENEEHQIIVKLKGITDTDVKEGEIISKPGNISVSEKDNNFQTAISGKLNLKDEQYSIANTIKEKNIAVIETKTEDFSEVLRSLNDNDNVIYAQPDYKVITMNGEINDKQWAIQNYGQTVDRKTGESGFDLELPEAWKITQGSEDVVVGVIDTGIDINHPDIKENIWVNDSEIQNGADTDGNGYIDDINGWDFVNNDNSVYDMDVVDEHGTHMAGIIAANGNVKGVAPKVKIMPLKALSHSSGYTSDIIEAIEYAKNKGVKIINCSFASIDYNPALEEAIASNPDILFVCAAGNYGAPTTKLATFPACYNLDNIITVSASNNKGKLSEISSYGEYVDVAAPGIGIYSTLPEENYGYKDGTSCSAAYVSGVAALVLSNDCYLKISELKNKIINSVTANLPKESENGDADTEGMVNAKNVFEASGESEKSGDLSWDSSLQEQNNFAKYPFYFEYGGESSKILFDSSAIFNSIKLKIYQRTSQEKEVIYLVDTVISGTNEYQLPAMQTGVEYVLSIKTVSGDDICEYTGTVKFNQMEDNFYFDYNILHSQSYSSVPTQPAASGKIYTTEAEKENLVETAAAGTKWEVESNNTISLADRTYDDYNNYGYIGSEDDVDYFKVKFSSSGVANFWLGNIPDGCDYDLFLYDSGGTVLGKSRNNGSEAELISYYPVEADVFYYMKVESYSGYNTSSAYFLRAKWYETPSSYESNDTVDTAYTLSAGNQTVKDSISSGSDIDYYKVVLNTKELFELKLTRPNSKYRFEIYKSTNLNQSIISTTGTSYTKELNAGTYYIKIYTISNYSSTSKYTLKVIHSPVTSISLGNSYTNTLTGSEHAYFTLVLNNAIGVNITLDEYGSANYDLYLYDSEYNSVIDESTGTGSTEMIEQILDAGTYKIGVKRCSGTAGSFTLSTSTTVKSDDADLTVGTDYPTTMQPKQVKAITVLATNKGARAWTYADGYKLSALDDSTDFVNGDILLNSSDRISYKQSKSFIFNITAPEVETSKSYTMGWQMKHNSLKFGQKYTKNVTVSPNYDVLSINTIKTISGKANKQRYTVNISSTGNYVFRTFKYSTACDTKLTLYNSALSKVASNDDIVSGNYYSRIEASLSSGTYYIDVEELNNKPIYCQLIFEKYSESNLSVGNTVTVNGNYEGYYTFTVSSSGTYILTTKYYSKNSDTYLLLYNSVGNKVAENDNDSSNYSRISTYLDSGTYHVRATTYDYYKKGENKKAYCKLTLSQQNTTPSTENTSQINITYPNNNSVIRLYDGASLKITGTMSNVRGVTVTVNDQNVSGVKNSGGRFECSYTPTDSRDYTIVATGTAAYGGNNPTSTVKVTILVNDDGDDFDTATSIKEGMVRTAAIDYAEDIDCFMLTPKSSDWYSIHTLGTTDTVINVYNSNYTLMGYNDDDFTNRYGENADVPLYLEKNNTYYIMVHCADQSGTGDYKLSVGKLKDDNTSYKTLSYGIAKSGKIDYPEDEDIYMFVPSETKSYTFRTMGAGDTMAVLYDDDGNFMEFNNDISDSNENCEITASLESGRQYFFAVKNERSYMYGNVYQVIVQ